MISCFQEIKGGSMGKIWEDFASGLIKGMVKMNKKDKNQAFCIIFFCFVIFLLCCTIYQQNILINKYEETLKTYKVSNTHASERLEEINQNIEIAKIISECRNNKNTKEEIAEVLEEYFKTKRSRGK